MLGEAHGAMTALDRWVAECGNGAYIHPDAPRHGPLDLFPDCGIQQVRAEIAEFAEVLAGLDRRGTAIEIGLGFHGSTHFLWRQLFDRVVTIEKNVDRVRAFGRHWASFTGSELDQRSGFIYGLSSDPGVVAKAYRHVGSVDLLFIDGDHRYAAALADWLLYHGLVRQGGIIAFHDVTTIAPGDVEAPTFLADLSAGAIDGRQYQFRKIVHSADCGIGYLTVE